MNSIESGPRTTTGEITIVANRGAMTHTLENTIDSFLLAEQMGCREIELDLRPTADGRIVVIHDRTMDRLVADEADEGLVAEGVSPKLVGPWPVNLGR